MIAHPSTDRRQRLLENLAQVRETIAAACARAGRRADSVHLVVVTKFADPELIRLLLAADVRDLGENRVQQLVARAAGLGASREGLPDEAAREAAPGPSPLPRWHMVGHLQRNKVKPLLRCCRVLHSLDSLRLAEAIEQQLERPAEPDPRPLDAFLEVNVSGEASKGGVGWDQAAPLAEALQRMRHVRLRGLMTMAPLEADPQRARPCFARLRELLQDLRRRGVVADRCVHLSMGMTHDYAVAIEEGATYVRIGTAVFEGLLPEAAAG